MPRTVIATLRITAYLALTVACIPVQWGLLTFAYPKINPYRFPRWYHRLCCRIFGLKVVVEGDIAQGGDVVYISNHVSYLDIPVLGSVLKTAFVAKNDVESWPLFGLLARLQRTLFVSRNPQHAEQGKQDFLTRLAEPLPLVLFAEGTSTLGSEVLPFKSTLFEVFLNQNLKLQPLTLSILETDGKPASTEQDREIFAWGNIEIPPHLWRVSKAKGCIIKVKFQKPIESLSFNNRKQLSTECWQRVAEGLDLSPAHA